MPVACGIIHEEGWVFEIGFPDFPGCASGGSSEDEALRKGTEALAFHVAGMLTGGNPLPDLRPLHEILALGELQGGRLVLVPFERPTAFAADPAPEDDEPEPIIDEDNPEWTEEDFARAKPASELPPEILAQFPKTLGSPKKPSRSG